MGPRCEGTGRRSYTVCRRPFDGQAASGDCRAVDRCRGRIFCAESYIISWSAHSSFVSVRSFTSANCSRWQSTDCGERRGESVARISIIRGGRSWRWAVEMYCVVRPRKLFISRQRLRSYSVRGRDPSLRGCVRQEILPACSGLAGSMWVVISVPEHPSLHSACPVSSLCDVEYGNHYYIIHSLAYRQRLWSSTNGCLR